MPFKLNDDGTLAQAENGLPIYVGPDGSERPYDVDQKAKQIAELTEKSSKRGKELETLSSRYAALAEIEDISAFLDEHKKNAETVASLADKDRETESNVQKRISEALKAAVTPVAAERDKLKADLAAATESLNKSVIGSAFASSKFVAEKLVNPALAQQLFAGNFQVKDGRPVGRDQDGNDIFGADGVATFDEALHKLVEASPFRDNILKPAPGGAGTSSHTAATYGGGKMSPDQAGRLSPEDYAKARKEGRI